jgi:hypothetical protein
MRSITLYANCSQHTLYHTLDVTSIFKILKYPKCIKSKVYFQPDEKV